MATEFQLPDIAPPGNTFPSRTGTPTRAAKLATGETPNLKIDTRQIIVTVTAAPPTDNIYPPPPVHTADTRILPRLGTWQDSEPDGSAAPARESPESGSSATLVRENSRGVDERSPAMRSMFPQFVPDIRLSQQQYFPTLERVPQVSADTEIGAQYSPSLYSQPHSPPITSLAADPWAASRITSTILTTLPPRVTEETSVKVSSPEELLDLWTIANGQESSEAAEHYTLAFKW